MDTSIDNTWNTTQRESQGKMEAEKKHRSRAYKIEKHRIWSTLIYQSLPSTMDGVEQFERIPIPVAP